MRTEFGMTQSDLAKQVGCSQSMIVRWEKGECEPTQMRLRRVRAISRTGKTRRPA